MKHKISLIIVICILVLIIMPSNVTHIAHAENNTDSKLVVYLSGDIIEKVQVTLEFENNDPLVFAIPCIITEDNIIFDSENFLFDFAAYENYSICVAAPIGKTYHFSLSIMNEHNEIYRGITLQGTIINGEYTMYLNIPIVEREFESKRYIRVFSAYSIVQAFPYSSISYQDDGRKSLTPERAGEELLFPMTSENNKSFEYAYSMDRVVQKETWPESVTIVLFSPLVICIFQMLVSDDGKNKVFGIRNIVLYSIVLICMVITVWFRLKFYLALWALIVMLILFLLCIASIGYRVHLEKGKK